MEEFTLEQLLSQGAKPIKPDFSGGLDVIKKEEPLSLGERFKMSFGSSEVREQLKQKEEAAGLRGKFDFGDIADIAGSSLPVIGAVAGAPFGGLAGSAVGTGLGEIARQAIDKAFGISEGYNAESEFGTLRGTGEAVKQGIYTYAGGWALGKIFNMVMKILPNKLVSTIFKQSADDIALEIKSEGKNLVQSEEVLREGFKGNAKAMMKFALDTMKDLDKQAHGAVAGKTVNIDKRTVINTISDYVSNFKSLARRYGYEPDIIKRGQQIMSGMNKAKGNKIPAEIAYDARKFIDSVRRTSSFKTHPKLGTLEDVYKSKANYLRRALADQIPNFDNIMKRYKIHIDAFEDLSKYAARTQNKEIFDLIDVFIMYGIDPTAYLARHALTSASVKTKISQGLYKTGNVLEDR